VILWTCSAFGLHMKLQWPIRVEEITAKHLKSSIRLKRYILILLLSIFFVKDSTFVQFYFDMYDDQFDFHSYSLRKMTLRTYIDLIRMEDTLRKHPLYYKSAVAAVQVYIQLYDSQISKEKEKEKELGKGFGFFLEVII
jgi:hypothetical protein